MQRHVGAASAQRTSTQARGDMAPGRGTLRLRDMGHDRGRVEATLCVLWLDGQLQQQQQVHRLAIHGCWLPTSKRAPAPRPALQ